MKPRQLAKRLGEYGIKSQNIRVGGNVLKGYQKEQFADVFTRYLTIPSGDTLRISATPLQNGSNQSPEPLSSVANIPLRSGNENPSATLEPPEISHCSAVADKTPLDTDDIEERIAIQQFDGGMQ